VFYHKALLSPEPKRLSLIMPPDELFSLQRSFSCEVTDQFLISELTMILGQNNESTSNRNSSPLFSKLSKVPPQREHSNPIVNDEKFILLESTLSTSEDSGSDSDRFLQSFWVNCN